MATVNFKAHKHHLKSDGSINVKLIVYHKGKRAYPDTAHYVSLKQLKKNFDIKDPGLLATLTTELGEYRRKISELGRSRLDAMSVQELAEYLIPKMKVHSDQIDFVVFARELQKEYADNGKTSTANGIRMVTNNLIDFIKSEVIYTSNVTPELLKSFRKYLSQPHDQIRKSQYNKEYAIKQNGLAESSIITSFNTLKLIFNAARDKYNDEDAGVILIKNQPFRKIKVGVAAPSKNRAISIAEVKYIRDCPLKAGSVAEMVRDLNILSFYLCGMNAKDIYLLTDKNIVNGRVEYNRSKTKEKRVDNAFISIKIIDEAKPILDKWIGILRRKYNSPQVLQTLMSTGNRTLARTLSKNYPEVFPQGYILHFYSFRHTFASEARNTLRYSLSDVGEALNHKSNSITDTYIKRDWGIIDRMQRDVADLLKD